MSFILAELQNGIPDEQGEHPCVICGKATDGTRWVRLGTIFAVGECVVMANTVVHDDHGYHPIGSGCARQLPASYVTADPYEGART